MLVSHLTQAAQKAERIIQAPGAGDLDRQMEESLIAGETALRELNTAAIWYDAAPGHETSFAFLGPYAEEVRMLRQNWRRQRSLTAEELALLRDIALDLNAVIQAYSKDVLLSNRPAQLEAVRQKLRQELRYPIARDLMGPGTAASP